jgi:catechol 2,3-dioxygenase-like lactoylglutathione lyase family enzyme
MKRLLSILAATLACIPLAAQEQPAKPTITAVAGIRLLGADLEKSREFYGKELGLRECRSDAALCFQVNPRQKIELNFLGREKTQNRLVFVAFETRNTAALRQSLTQAGIQEGDQITQPDGTKFFEVLDPEDHAVRFVEYFRPPLSTKTDRELQLSTEIIHVGYVVRDRTAMDHFYKNVLGFRIYWHGGMKDDETSWVDMQVSDRHGTEWLEYMLNVLPNADQHTLGVMNHIALGVPDIHAAEAQLRKNGWTGTEQPKMGRDGKWQLNLYDPDETRVELMEFTPTQKPCCAEYTGPHPGPKQ